MEISTQGYITVSLVQMHVYLFKDTLLVFMEPILLLCV